MSRESNKKSLPTVSVPIKPFYFFAPIIYRVDRQPDERPDDRPVELHAEPDFYFHSTRAMNPMKLTSILKHGVVSLDYGRELGYEIDSNGLACNGSDYVSVSTEFGGCVRLDDGAFHFVIDRSKLTQPVRRNPSQPMELERQVAFIVPREAIVAVRLSDDGFIDIDNDTIELGINAFSSRTKEQVASYLTFMKAEFSYELSEQERSQLNDLLTKITLDHCSHKEFKLIQKKITLILKKHLKKCYKSVLGGVTISPYAILRHHHQDIPVLDKDGNPIIEKPAAASLFKEKPKQDTRDSADNYCGFRKGFLL